MRYPRTIVVSPSSRSLGLIAAIHLVAAISFVQLPGVVWPVVGGLVVLLSFVACARACSRNMPRLIELGDDGLLRFPESEGDEARPCGRMADFAWLRWLEWRELSSGRCRALMLWRAECSAEDWRTLGVWLRHKAVSRPEPLSDEA